MDRERERRPDGGSGEATRPKIVREDQITQASEVENLPHAENIVDEAAEESFPASDPPAYSGRAKRHAEDDREARREG